MPIHHDPLNPTLTLNSTNPRHKNIILTGPRTTDALATISAFADPAVYLYLVGPPFPYTQESFDFQFQVLDPATRTAVGELWDAKVEAEKGGIEERKWEDRKWVGSGLPFPTIREVVVGEDGEREERFLGGLGVRRRGYATVLDEEAKERLVRENNERKVGDPGTEWEVGCESLFCFAPFVLLFLMLLRFCGYGLCQLGGFSLDTYQRLINFPSEVCFRRRYESGKYPNLPPIKAENRERIHTSVMSQLPPYFPSLQSDLLQIHSISHNPYPPSDSPLITSSSLAPSLPPRSRNHARYPPHTYR